MQQLVVSPAIKFFYQHSTPIKAYLLQKNTAEVESCML